jgi:hypothetical protein
MVILFISHAAEISPLPGPNLLDRGGARKALIDVFTNIFAEIVLFSDDVKGRHVDLPRTQYEHPQLCLLEKAEVGTAEDHPRCCQWMEIPMQVVAG